MEFLGHMVTGCFSFLRDCPTFLASGCIISSSQQQSMRVPIALSTLTIFFFVLKCSHSSESEMVSHWFWFAFPQWLKILSITSCVFWPFIYLLCLFRSIAHFLIVFLLLSCRNFLYHLYFIRHMAWIFFSYRLRCHFHFLDNVLSCRSF